MRNEGRYTATPVACGWVGLVFEVARAVVHKHRGDRLQKQYKRKRGDGPTDQPMDQ